MPRRNERDVVLHFTREWFQHSNWSMERFANDALAPALVAAGLIEPIVEPEGAPAYLKLRKAWGQRIARMFNGDGSIPLEWKWVWINEVPEPYRNSIHNELQALAGCLNVPLPDIRPINGVRAAKARMGVVMQEFGEYVTASAGPAADGHYSRDDDRAAVEEALAKGSEAVQAILAELQALATGAGLNFPAAALAIAGKAAAGVRA